MVIMPRIFILPHLGKLIKINSSLTLTRDRRQIKQFLLLRRRQSSGWGEPVYFSAFGREIRNPESHSQTVIQIIDIFASVASGIRTCTARQRYLASQRPTALPTELSGHDEM